MAIFPFLGGPRRPRTERGERHLLAMRILLDAVTGPGSSVRAWSDDDRLCFKLIVDGGPVLEFRGFDSRGHASYQVHYEDGDLALVDVHPRAHVDPGLFSRRPPILDRKGWPTVSEAEYVSEIAARYPEIYRDILERAEGARGHLRPGGKALAALKATAFLGLCSARGIDPQDWSRHAEDSALWPNPAEAREVRRVVGEEMVAALEGRSLMTGGTAPLPRR